jgi:hypothetical protein
MPMKISNMNKKHLKDTHHIKEPHFHVQGFNSGLLLRLRTKTSFAEMVKIAYKHV